MLASFSVKKPYTIAVCVVLIIILGVISFSSMTTDLLPGLNLPYILVITPYPGASPEKVELSVTKPIESTVSTISGLEELSSVSSENSSTVILQFAQGTNMDTAMIELSTLMDRVKGSFEDGVGSPIMMRISPDLLPVMVLSADADGMDLDALSRLVREDVQPAIERVEGVGSVSAIGLLEKQLTFELDQHKIDALNVEVLRAVDEELAKTQEELNDARTELNDGKSKLEREQEKRSRELAEAEIALSDGRRQVQDGIAQVDEALSQIETIKRALPRMWDVLVSSEESYIELQQTRETMAQAVMLRGQLEAYQAKISDPNFLLGYTAADDATQMAMAGEMQAMITVLNGLGLPTPIPDLPSAQPSPGEMTTQVAILVPTLTAVTATLPNQAALDAVDSAIAQIDSTVTALYIEVAELLEPYEIRLPAAGNRGTLQKITALKNALVEMDQKIIELETELPQTKAELEETLTDLDEKHLQLAEGKVLLTTEFAKAGAALDLGEKQLEAGEEQFADAKEAAYKQAGLDGVITKEMISQVLMAQNFSMPAGYVYEGEAQYMVKVGEQFSDAAQLESLVLFHADVDSIGDILLTDVGSITHTDNYEDLYAIINGNEGVVLTIQKQSLASTAEVCALLRSQMDSLQEELPGLHLTALQDQGVYINIVTSSVIENLLYGGLLAVLVLIIFLKSWKPTIIIALSIPISLMLSIVLMYFSGVTLNLISLSGLALGVGMLVDNSIVAIENIYRLRMDGVPLLDACVRGVRELTGALTASTLTTVSVFLPIVFTHGITRELFTDMGLTIAYSLLASLIVSLTLVPAMGSAMLGNVNLQAGTGKRSKGRIYNAYERLLRRVLRHKAPLLLGVTALLIACGIAAYFMGTQMFPPMEADQFSITLETAPGVSNAQVRQMSDTVAERVTSLPGVQTVGAMQQSSVSLGSGSGHSISMYVLLEEKRPYTNGELATRILEDTADLDCTLTVQTEMMNMNMLTGTGISVNIEGQDLDTLAAIANDIGDMLAATPGTAHVDDGMEDASLEVRVSVDKNAAAQYNLTTAQVFAEVASALRAENTATTVTITGEDYPLVVQYDQGYARHTIGNLPLTVQEEGEEVVIALSDIADISEALSPSSIHHTQQVRTMTVSAEIADGYNVGLVTRDFQRVFSEYMPPEGYEVTLEGENEAINEALRDVGYMILLAVAFIYFIMVAQFQSLLSPFIVLFTIPLAFTGGFLALILCGFEISIIAMIGMLMLAGVVVNNGIVFVETVNQLRMEGMDKTEALVQTGRMRMRPILMTALTTILGLTTMALGIGAGASMVQPMAVVTIGGLSYATLLTLFVVPAIYDILHKKPMQRRELQDEKDAREWRAAQQHAAAPPATPPAPRPQHAAGPPKSYHDPEEPPAPEEPLSSTQPGQSKNSVGKEAPENAEA